MKNFNIIPASKQINHESNAATFGGRKSTVILQSGEKAVALINETGNWTSSMTVDLALGLDFELNHVITDSNFNNNTIRCMFGISDTKTPNDTYPTFKKFRNAIYIEAKNSIEVYENGFKAFDGNGINCDIGDIFTLRSVNGRISYLKNNVEFCASNLSPISTGWFPSLSGGDMGEFNIYGGDKTNIFATGNLACDTNISRHRIFDNLSTASIGYKYSHNIDFNNKLKINGVPCDGIARKGYRPNALYSRWSTQTNTLSAKIIKEPNGELKINDTVVGTVEMDIKSFYVLAVAGGGGGGKATAAWLDCKSGGGGGSGAYFWINVTLSPDFAGIVSRIDIGQNNNSGGDIYYNWRDLKDNYIKAGSGGRGGDGAGGGGGKGSAGVVQYAGGFENISINEVDVISIGAGKEGCPTRPNDHASTSDMPAIDFGTNMPEGFKKTMGGFTRGTVGNQNEAGPGAGGYMGRGGDAGDCFGDGKLGSIGGVSAGSGGADSNLGYNSGSQVGGPAYLGIFF